MTRRITILLLVLLNVGCDQYSKDLVRQNVVPLERIYLIQDHFLLTHVENTGAMLGFGQSLPPLPKMVLLQIVPILVLTVLLFRLFLKSGLDQWLLIAFAFVIGGGIGNLMDRIRHGSVTDFFQLKFGFLQTGIFNMADVSVTLGALLILGLFLFGKKVSL
ncbi:MAG: signal peptidase II [Bacteroidota bacterium]